MNVFAVVVPLVPVNILIFYDMMFLMLINSHLYLRLLIFDEFTMYVSDFVNLLFDS